MLLNYLAKFKKYEITVERLLISYHQNKRQSDRRGTARHAMLANSCYVSRGMTVWNVSNNKSDLQRHSNALAMVSPFDRPRTISY